MGRPTDQDLDVSVAAMLRFGVTLSAVVVLIGGLMYLRHPWSAIPMYSQFEAAGPSLRTLSGIFQSATQPNAKSVIQAGLVLLIATPVARVVFCIIGFARQRRRLYVLVRTLVLILLTYSLTFSLR